MNREDYYKHYQANLDLLNCEMEQIKISTQQAIGEKAWLERMHRDPNQIAVVDRKIKACTRLYTFLLCSWFEARLLKMLYENSAVAFTDSEISRIRGKTSDYNTMSQKWKESFSIAVCRSYGFSYSANTDYTSCFVTGSIEEKNYTTILGLFNEISDAITIRNRLGHGQWDVQFYSDNTSVSNYPFFSTYDNIQKLDMLKQCYNEIAEIINSYVTCKDKTNPNFNVNISDRINRILQIKNRIQNCDYQKYVNQFELKHRRKVERNRQ